MNDRPTLGLVGCGACGRHIFRDLRSPGGPVHIVARSGASAASRGGPPPRLSAADGPMIVERIEQFRKLAGMAA